MSLREIFRGLRLDLRSERYMKVGSLPVDADLAARNAQRQAEARRSIGAKWLCATPLPRREVRR